MNVLDFLILGILGISMIAGAYKGFVDSVLNLLSFFLCWIGTIVFSPMLSSYIIERHPYLLQTLITFSEGALRIDSVFERALPVSAINVDRILELVNEARFPYPFDRILLANLQNEVFPHLQTLGEYFNHTIALVILNILSFIAIYFALRIVFYILISVAKGIVGLPVLKQFDGILGAGLGLLRGILIVSLVFLALPVVMTVVPVDLIGSFVETSLLADFFIEFNIFTMFLSGKI